MRPVIKVLFTNICNIVRRENRFVVKVRAGSQFENAYINNTGRLHDILVPGRKAYCMESSGRKTKYRLIAVEDRGFAALIDTRIQEEVFRILVEKRMISWLTQCSILRRMPRLGQSVLDYLVECNNTKRIYVELKSAVLRGDDKYAMYPDCPSLRGRRHIQELISHVEMGGHGIIVFIAALPYVEYFKPNKDADPIIAELLRKAKNRGVIVKSINIIYNPVDHYIYLVNDDLPVNI